MVYTSPYTSPYSSPVIAADIALARAESDLAVARALSPRAYSYSTYVPSYYPSYSAYSSYAYPYTHYDTLVSSPLRYYY
ncbi:hypothetical protein DIPPA_27201 [Diplonema papillatum]|nr:hypothetical protein DIPPA_04882 [Diplonema papillatum]KAJ9460168.1 hypothetical protein DIPPA_04872 [Diplonema papillatum]KAJ9460169.1 hypothetical protein DIPPA_04900 [Diplonema papillatum]KAJ9460172.1 hypothetical protein DIPPA_04863 [Diplonema papillatum]KAJ9460173.1 hypothetical protein DIPPA_04889 [Diplonema papillatum]|eukprot:gene9162-14206_t